jgi:STE24 endopeptidase
VNTVVIVVIALVGLKWASQLWLEQINRLHVQAHSSDVPEAFKQVITPEAYAKSVEYTLVKGLFHQLELSFNCVVLLVVLFSGVLPWIFHWFNTRFGGSPWSMAAFLLTISIGLSLPGLPLDWHEQFRIEDRFGFNTSTQKTWWMDRLKGLLLGVLLGYPMLLLLLKLVGWTGRWWWLWGWAALMAFQFLMLLLAPVLIMPLFNKFTPLPEGTLRERLLRLAGQTKFHARSIQVMDGSKRSRHSNAFFTGFGSFRKIVLFDTLIQQLAEPELEAVLAHEIGHYKKKHIPKMLIASAIGSLVGFYLLSLLSSQAWFYQAFGFPFGSPLDNKAPAFLLFALLSGVATFWLSPLAHWWSRRYEYQADAFAAQTMNETAPMIWALRKLNEKNLSNLTPHPVYSGFYYSHPTLLEREQALLRSVS